jgi:large subunit ribosomal protein L18e
MAKRTGPTNPYLRNLIKLLREKSVELNAPIWKSIAKKLEKPTRQRVEVNLYHIDKYVKDGETIIVPGKVLSSGELTKKVKIVAWQFSDKAKEKIEKSGSKTMTIEELIKENPKGSNVRIMV